MISRRNIISSFLSAIPFLSASSIASASASNSNSNQRYLVATVIDYNGTGFCDITSEPKWRRVLNTDKINPYHVSTATVLENGDLLVVYYDFVEDKTFHKNSRVLKHLCNDHGHWFSVKRSIILSDWSIDQTAYRVQSLYWGVKTTNILTKKDFLVDRFEPIRKEYRPN